MRPAFQHLSKRAQWRAKLGPTGLNLFGNWMETQEVKALHTGSEYRKTLL